MARRILNLLEGLLNLVTVLIIVVVGVYAGYALWDNQQIYAEAGNVQADMLLYKQKAEEQAASNAEMLEELRTINEDVRAWLTLDNTKIDYPVVQGVTNFTYLNTDVYGKFSMAGSIFADARSDKNFWDNYTLVHGHHMTEHRMFGDLDLYKDKTFFDTYKTGVLILEDRTYNLLTFACLLVDSNDPYIFIPERWQDEDIEILMDFTRENSLHYDEDTIVRLIEEKEAAKAGGRHPQIISMATCSSEYDAARTILLCEMIPVEETE